MKREIREMVQSLKLARLLLMEPAASTGGPMTTPHTAKPTHQSRKKPRVVKTLSAAVWAQVTVAIRQLAGPTAH
jgi:hypothetical protein